MPGYWVLGALLCAGGGVSTLWQAMFRGQGCGSSWAGEYWS